MADKRLEASLRWRALTRGFAQATVMLRPMAAGVFGIARTIAVPAGSVPCRKAIVLPAMIDSATVDLPTKGASAGMASGAFCGFTATTIALASAILLRGLMTTPRRASALMAFVGCGSSTTSRRGSSPRVSQPWSMAEPIFPAPSRTRRPESPRSGLSADFARFMATIISPFAPLCLPGCLEHRGVERFARGLAGPDHELEGRKIAFAGLECRPEQRLALFARGLRAACEHEGVSKHHNALGHPMIKVADPKTFIDQRDQRLHFSASPFGHPQIERTRQVQRFDIAHPRVRELIVGPAPGNQDRDFVVACAFE